MRYKVIALIVTALFLTSCVPMQKKSTNSWQEKRVDTLFELNEKNEQAFVYYHHCLAATEDINENFLQNFDQTVNLLFDECRKEFGWSPEDTMNRILKRREHIQKTLGEQYKNQGCQTPDAQQAKQHYRQW